MNTMHKHVAGTPLTIGKPTPNTVVYILDDNLQQVSQGESGVIWAAGCGICLGYLNRPDLNAIKFKQDPFSPSRYASVSVAAWGIANADAVPPVA